ncbi:MAG TPA: hypothetical protein VFJ57_00560 [Solirubrobacterales bacterium]|nr:hypothetical protein [Solirubrobacterales bacterium]
MRSWPSFVTRWGSTAPERAAPYPCDALLAAAETTLWRAVDVAAPAAVVFRWLCQLRAAPYSYDLLDNFGRRSPQELTPGLERLEVGQRVMTIFRLAEFEPGRSLTVVSRGPLFGEVACTYRVEPSGEGASRLVLKILARYPAGLRRPLLRLLLPPGDLVMARRQLLNLKRLAERSPAAPEAAAAPSASSCR